MNLNETAESLNLLIASDSKVQIWMILDGNRVELEHDRKPMRAADALAAARVAFDVADGFGLVPEFHFRRWEA